MNTNIVKQITTNNEKSEAKKPLTTYSFVGGRYPVFIFFESIATVFSVIIFCFLCSTQYDSVLYTKTGIPKSIFLAVIIGCFSVLILSIIYSLLMYARNRGTYFEITDTGISGVGLVKELNNSLVKFELSYNDIDIISIRWGYLTFSSNGVVFKTMLTSRDYKKQFEKIMIDDIKIQKNIFKG